MVLFFPDQSFHKLLLRQYGVLPHKTSLLKEPLWYITFLNLPAVCTLNLPLILLFHVHLSFQLLKVSEILWEDYGIATRAGAHCAPLMHETLGTTEQGVVRFSFSSFNTMEEIKTAIEAIRELAAE